MQFLTLVTSSTVAACGRFSDGSKLEVIYENEVEQTDCDIIERNSIVQRRVFLCKCDYHLSKQRKSRPIIVLD